MIDKTKAMDRLIEQDADLIDVPAMTDVEKEREAIVAWLRGDGDKIPALSAFASLVSGNNMPSMSGDDRDRLRPPVMRRRFDATIEHICKAIERGDHLKGLPNDQ